MGLMTPLIIPFFAQRLTVARSTLRSLATSEALRNSFINSTIEDTVINVNRVFCCICCIINRGINVGAVKTVCHLARKPSTISHLSMDQRSAHHSSQKTKISFSRRTVHKAPSEQVPVSL